ncbi:helix-turn-helix domain-containing protein [Avibacterium sp. 20-15]|uniref:helix-turn-helix domain-containing protein n=1 Tax=unclassified Avibacterium TaxID=2685287 RepID=UPI002025E53E|nr:MULTISPECIES: helix-turn-helix transcriptional regulator [unclassified Avibacterium]MCW9732559.1 helix-turn-helix domain-containing protein [Avibacterium sp. 20-15]URL04713.1 helix-turn-helix domain-containing protein [Avibacterium sp. 20-132]
MKVKDQIKMRREANKWTQEEMANRLHMSTNNYAKLERGETKLNLHRLEQIANVFNIDVLELMNSGEKNVTFLMNDHNTNYYGSSDKQIQENEKLQLIINHQKELLLQKDSEINTLKTLVELLQKK